MGCKTCTCINLHRMAHVLPLPRPTPSAEHAGDLLRDDVRGLLDLLLPYDEGRGEADDVLVGGLGEQPGLLEGVCMTRKRKTIAGQCQILNSMNLGKPLDETGQLVSQ